jgi:hypothetical protein
LLHHGCAFGVTITASLNQAKRGLRLIKVCNIRSLLSMTTARVLSLFLANMIPCCCLLILINHTIWQIIF